MQRFLPGEPGKRYLAPVAGTCRLTLADDRMVWSDLP